MSSSRPHVLVSAYACDPHRGSEEGVGWGWVRAIARRHRVTLLTAAWNQPVLEAWFGDHPDERGDLRIAYVPHRRWHYAPSKRWRWIEGSPLRPLVNVVYSAWLRDAKRVAERVLRDDPYELLHLVTYVGYRFPGSFWQLPVPFVWGPIGGLENTAWPMLRALGPVGGLYHGVRNVINAVQRRALPGPRRALRRAAPHGVIAATGAIQRLLQRHYGVTSRVISEIGLPPIEATAPRERHRDGPLAIVWSGEHHPGKALPLLLEALARLPTDLAWHLTILGRGPRTDDWRRTAERLGVSSRCTWPGWVPRDEALGIMRSQHVLAITSMKDLTSTVLLEAVSLGLAVIAPDHCGFPDVLAPDKGLLVPVRRPRDFVPDYAKALDLLARDESLRHRIAAAGWASRHRFSWDAKARAVDGIYTAVLADGASA